MSPVLPPLPPAARFWGRLKKVCSIVGHVLRACFWLLRGVVKYIAGLLEALFGLIFEPQLLVVAVLILFFYFTYSRSRIRRPGVLDRAADTVTQDVASPDQVFRRPITIPIPVDATRIDDATELHVGDKLHACYADKWELVTVVALLENGAVRVNWHRWPSSTYNLAREDLIIPDASTKDDAMSGLKAEEVTSDPAKITVAPLANPTKRRTTRRKISKELPAECVVVANDVPLIPGAVLDVCYASSWYPVTVVAANDDGTVRVNWHDWRSSTYDMVREDLVIRASVLAKLCEYASGTKIDTTDFQRAIEDIKPVDIVRYKIKSGLPPNHVRVDQETALVAGAKLRMERHRTWEPVTVMLVREDGTLRVNRENSSSYNLDLVRDDLIISEEELARLTH